MDQNPDPRQPARDSLSAEELESLALIEVLRREAMILFQNLGDERFVPIFERVVREERAIQAGRQAFNLSHILLYPPLVAAIR